MEFGRDIKWKCGE